MQILPDTEIAKLIQSGAISSTLTPNPWTLDVTIGGAIYTERAIQATNSDTEDMQLDNCRWDRKYLNEHEIYYMKPGEFLLCHTTEVLDLPEDIGASLFLKSSRAREGYNHSSGLWVDPGFHGAITLELKNYSNHWNLPIHPGLRIAQLQFLKGDKAALSYRKVGRYNGFASVQESLG
jgi:deoxycytidine triphosphate deaminase